MRRILILVMMSALLGACATYPDIDQQRLETLPQRYSQFDLTLAWETRVAEGKTIIDGVVKNVRYHLMHDLEVWVSVLDPAGKVVEQSMTFIIPLQLGMDETAPFTVKLPYAVAPGTRLRFTYKYRGDDGGDGFTSGQWIQSFDALVPAR